MWWYKQHSLRCSSTLSSSVKKNMDEIIARAANYINEELEFEPEFEDISSSSLINTRNLLIRLLQPDSASDNLTQLFCRQLNRLMDYNKSFSEKFWIDLHDDLCSLKEKQNLTQSVGGIKNHLLKRISLEEKLVQRELMFKQTYGKRKRLNELFHDHRMFFKDYLQNCIRLHSEIQIQGLINDLHTFLSDCYGFTTDTSSFQKIQKQLDEKLKYIHVSLDCSTRLVKNIQDEYLKYTYSQYEVNNQFSNFIPSAEPRFNEHSSTETLAQVLGSERWLVILGDPGSGKTRCLQWITYIFAEAAYRQNEEIVLKGNDRYPIRIPILIRVGEFASWLEEHQNKTLIDYIGKHTWFSHTYKHDDTEIVLKELIHHGHALILIDGLDEIPEIGRRKEIVELVQKFIDEYVNGSDFISTSDISIFIHPSKCYSEDIIETQPPNISGGNQVIVTSRLVGYHLHPFQSPFIHHYSLALMSHTEAEKFVKNWLIQVEKYVLDVLVNEGIPIDKKIIEIVSTRRKNTAKNIFQNSSELLLSNPSLLSSVCIFIFQSSDEIQLKSRVQIYSYAIQLALGNQQCKESHMSESLLSEFLTKLATYLHLYSPSGLIDAFDMKRLCYLVLKEHHFSNKPAELRENANQLISLLKCNNSVVDERGLQVFGFLHLSFQEYFVAQSLVKVSPMKDVVERILTFMVNPRFRESLLMAFEWISWKWASQHYDQLCNLLVISNSNYVIPFGTLLFFESIDNLQRLPSRPVIFTALNILLDHPYNIITETYFILNLYKLPKDIVIEWMKSYLRDDEHLRKFCKYLSAKLGESSNVREINSKAITPLIYQQLPLLNTASACSEFIVDQTFRRIVRVNDISGDIINKGLAAVFSLHDTCESDVHPLILAVIITVCGGIRFSFENDMVKIHFSSKHMHHESSIAAPIIKYLTNYKEPHSTKVQELIKHYENVLHTTLPSSTSINTVDTFIALICLKGLSQPLIYQEYYEYPALFLAFDKLRRSWFFLKRPFQIINYRYYSVDTSDTMKSDVESIIKAILSQASLSDEERLIFSSACAAALNKLCSECLSDSFTFNIFPTNNISRYLQCQPELGHSATIKNHQITKNIHPMQMFRHERCFLLTFVPQYLQQLYDCLFIKVTNETDSLPFIVFLSQCLIFFEKLSDCDPNFIFALSILQEHFKQYGLENYALMLEYRLSSLQSVDYDLLINVERQRISNVKNRLENQENDLQLFAASISLARVFQARKVQDNIHITLCTSESEEVRSAVSNVFDPILRIIALSIILDMKNPTIFNEEENNELRLVMITLLQSNLPKFPLLTSTLLFIRCHTAHQLCPILFQQMANVIGKKLNETSIDRENQAHEAVFIALHQLRNSDLSHYLLEFVKGTSANLSDLLQFNSTVFYQYFTKTPYHIGNPILLPIMYLTELAFDAQSLLMNKTDDHLDTTWSMKRWKQLWKDLPTDCKIMTFQMATWITNYLQLLDKTELHMIIKDMLQCLVVEKRSLSVLEGWLHYQMDKCLRIFAHYAALHLLICGSKTPVLIDCIREVFNIDKHFQLQRLLPGLFKSELIELSTLRQILILLNESNYYFPEIPLQIDRKEILILIFDLEFERITLNIDKSSTSLSKSFLSIVNYLSNDLQVYLVEYLRVLMNKQCKFENTATWDFIAVLIEWIIKEQLWNKEKEAELQEFFEYIFTFLQDQQSIQIQKVALSRINSMLIHNYSILREHSFLTSGIITNLEKVIFSYSIYPKDVLAICLLAYGNCLLRLQKSHNLSNTLQNILTNLYKTSASELISIRAAFCLIIAEKSSITSETIFNWLPNEWNSTPENKYNILLQQTLYIHNDHSYTGNIDELLSYIETHPTELPGKFVRELYTHLCSQCSNSCLIDPTPNYISIAQQFSSRNPHIFLDTIRKSCFGEDEFKRELYLYYMRKPKHSRSMIICIYTAFGILTADFIEMLTWIGNYSTEAIWDYMKNMKQISNREVIENIFQLLNSNGYNTDFKLFSCILRLLVQLAHAHIVSSLEVHERISLVFQSLSHDENFTNCCYKENIIDCLLDLSCVTKMKINVTSAELLSESDIDEDFQRTTQILAKKSALFLRRNYFLSIFRSISNSSN